MKFTAQIPHRKRPFIFTAQLRTRQVWRTTPHKIFNSLKPVDAQKNLNLMGCCRICVSRHSQVMATMSNDVKDRNVGSTPKNMDISAYSPYSPPCLYEQLSQENSGRETFVSISRRDFLPAQTGFDLWNGHRHLPPDQEKTLASEARDAYLAARVAAKLGIAYNPNRKQAKVSAVLDRYEKANYPDADGNAREEGHHLRGEKAAIVHLRAFFKCNTEELIQSKLDACKNWRCSKVKKTKTSSGTTPNRGVVGLATLDTTLKRRRQREKWRQAKSEPKSPFADLAAFEFVWPTAVARLWAARPRGADGQAGPANEGAGPRHKNNRLPRSR